MVVINNQHMDFKKMEKNYIVKNIKNKIWQMLIINFVLKIIVKQDQILIMKMKNYLYIVVNIVKKI